MIAALLRAVSLFPFKIGGYNINVSWYKGTRGEGGCGNGHRRRLTQRQEGATVLGWAGPRGREVYWVEATAANGQPLGGGDLYGGLLAISDLNNLL